MQKFLNGMLHTFSYAGYPNMVRLVLWLGADVNSKRKNYTAFERASVWQHMDVARIIATHPDFDPDIRQASGSTRLFVEVCLGRVELVKLLVDVGANVNILGRGNFTPLQVTKHILLRHEGVFSRQDEYKKYVAIEEILRKAGAVEKIKLTVVR